MRKTSNISLIAATLASAILISAPVFAEGGTSGSGSGTSSGSTSTETHTTATTAEGTNTTSHETTTETEKSGTTGDSTQTEAEKTGDHHLQGLKLKICDKRQSNITDKMSRIADRGQKQLDLFSSIATRVEAFYTDKGLTLANYDALVAAVNAQKTVSQTAVDAVKADKANFKCDGTDPAGAATVFKADLKSEITALKDYRTTIKDLIVGVKSVVSSDATKTEGTN